MPRYYTAVELSNVPLPAELDSGHRDEDHPTEENVSNKFQVRRSLLREPDNDERPRWSVRRFTKVLREERLMADRLKPIVLAGAASSRNYLERSCTTANAKQLFARRVPASIWLRDYTVSLLRNDVAAGLTVGVVLIPQGMAYAMLAELPPIYGLYSSLLPLPIYAAMCTSKHMTIGPFALVSLLVADSVSEVVSPDDEGYIGAVMLLSLMIVRDASAAPPTVVHPLLRFLTLAAACLGRFRRACSTASWLSSKSASSCASSATRY